MSTVRRSLGFQRYILSLQYHGSSFLGFSYQGNQEEESHHRRSVEGCLRYALQSLLDNNHNNNNNCGTNYDGTTSCWENIQVSSRTDRGVHALKNTCHVDIRKKTIQQINHHNHSHNNWTCDQIHRGLNFYLQRQLLRKEYNDNNEEKKKWSQRQQRLGDRLDWRNELRILRVLPAPESMPNPWSDQLDQPPMVDWNARFSATQRTYVYRILHSYGGDLDWFVPFEYDRAWRIHSSGSSGKPLDVQAMQKAANRLIGEHDFTSFRGKGCQRSSPIVNLTKVQVNSMNYRQSLDQYFMGGITGWQNNNNDLTDIIPGSRCQLVTLLFQGNSFVYRQVRNLTGCLVEVGRGRLAPEEVSTILAARNRAMAPSMAPAHGLFLVDVQHQGIRI